MDMTYDMLLDWADGKIMMYLVANGDVQPINYYEYSVMPLGKLPSGARLTPDKRFAFILAEHQNAQMLANS